MDKWIRAKDQLPEEGSRVLVCIAGIVQYVPAYRVEDVWLWDDDETFDPAPLQAITHWMHFPKPPKESS